MISVEYIRTFARYAAKMNGDLGAAAQRLTDAERRAQRGAFWGSIHGTLNHLLWGDLYWMSRFADWPRPTTPLESSANLYGTFDEFLEVRAATDARLEGWARTADTGTLSGETTWFNPSTLRPAKSPTGLLIAHMFNHQTHHRGQIHAMLTAAGERVADTDLPIVIGD